MKFLALFIACHDIAVISCNRQFFKLQECCVLPSLVKVAEGYTGMSENWIILYKFFLSRFKRCKDYSESTAQEKGNRRKRISDWAWTWDLHSFAKLQPHEPSVPATSCRSQPQIFRLPLPYVEVVGVPLYSDPLRPTPQGWYSVCDGNGLSGRQQHGRVRLWRTVLAAFVSPCLNHFG